MDTINRFKPNTRDNNKYHRSCSNQKDFNMSAMVAASHLFDSKKHKSPVVDREANDDLKSSNSLLKNSQHIINKVYKSKGKLKTSKLSSPKQNTGWSNEK